MTKLRYQNLTDFRFRNERLNRKEIKRGWHFCPGFDGSLERLIPCGCMRFGFRKREKKVHAAMEAFQRRMRAESLDYLGCQQY